ncbi:MAG: tRNA-(ms[2]io[6]A)-hydroxylase [Deltaproteobacteria bacterium CG11_big_fil_rev_8_21_14_0_20_45_16]|nr:MAG: tRNA-(ms[2]io[6]A)-hydroxylase [Deltaproteobacteria bacterium CG11_big_fil_rev_8_21_14_0_20_45_16]
MLAQGRESNESSASKPQLQIRVAALDTQTWIQNVLSNFDQFLINHAACERKASATAIQFVVRFPDRPELVDPMLRLAKEELHHFHEVMRLIQKRGLRLISDERDPYINALLVLARNGRNENFLDRLLIFGIAEARGTERFGLVGKHIQDEVLANFYQNLSAAEDRHHRIFLDLAFLYFSENEIRSRLDVLVASEAKIVKGLPIRAAVH